MKSNNIKSNNIKSKNIKSQKNIKYKKKNISKNLISKNLISKKNKKYKRKNKLSKKLQKYLIKGGGDADLSEIASSNIGKEESNSFLEKVIGSSNNNKGIVGNLIDKISLPGYLKEKSAIQDSPQMNRKEKLEEQDNQNRKDEIEERKKDKDDEYFEKKDVEEQELEIAKEEDDQKFSEELGSKGLLSGIGAQFQRQFDGADRRVSGINKDKALEAEKVKKLARTRTCSPTFVTGLNDLLGTCAKEELLNVYNKSVQKLKSKRDMFSFETNEKIQDLEELSFDEEQENNTDTNIKGVKLKEITNNNAIRELEDLIEKKLNYYDPDKKKSKKKVKKVKKNE